MGFRRGSENETRVLICEHFGFLEMSPHKITGGWGVIKIGNYL